MRAARLPCISTRTHMHMHTHAHAHAYTRTCMHMQAHTRTYSLEGSQSLKPITQKKQELGLNLLAPKFTLPLKIRPYFLKRKSVERKKTQLDSHVPVLLSEPRHPWLCPCLQVGVRIHPHMRESTWETRLCHVNFRDYFYCIEEFVLRQAFATTRLDQDQTEQSRWF